MGSAMKLADVLINLCILVLLIFQKNFVDLAIENDRNLIFVLLFYLAYILLMIMVIKALQFDKNRFLALVYLVFILLAVSGVFSRVIEKLMFIVDSSDLNQIVDIGAQTECYMVGTNCHNMAMCYLDNRACGSIPREARNALIRVHDRIGYVARVDEQPVIIVHSRAFTYFMFIPHQPALPFYAFISGHHFLCEERLSNGWYLCESDWS